MYGAASVNSSKGYYTSYLATEFAQRHWKHVQFLCDSLQTYSNVTEIIIPSVRPPFSKAP
jgi:hypothetical protein